MESVRNLNLNNVSFTSRKRDTKTNDTKSANNTVKNEKNHSNTLKWMALIAAAGICTAGALHFAYKKGKIDAQTLTKAKDAIKDAGEITTPIALTAAGTAIAVDTIKDTIGAQDTNAPEEVQEKTLPLEANLDYRIDNFNEYNKRRIQSGDDNLEFLKKHVSKISPEKIAIMPDNQLASLLYILNDSKMMLRLKKIEQLENDFTLEELGKMFKYYHDGHFRAWLGEDRSVIGCQKFEDEIHGTDISTYEQVLKARREKAEEKVIVMPQIEPKQSWFTKIAQKAAAAMF